MNEAFIVNKSTKMVRRSALTCTVPLDSYRPIRETRWGIPTHVLRSETTLLIRELPGSEYMKSKEPNVQECLKRTVATVVAE